VEYTGYDVQHKKEAATQAAGPGNTLRPTIVVSNGSGACPSGHLLMESVLRAAPLLEGTLPHEFYFFAGPLMSEEVYQRLGVLASLGRNVRNVRFSRYTPDLPGELRRAKLSVSMAGYNTVIDILSTQVPALVYPVTANGDQEQSLRARKLEKMGALNVLDELRLEPTRLALEIRQALHRRPPQVTLNLAGAKNSSFLIQKHLDASGTQASQTPATFPVAEGSGRVSHRAGSQIGESALCD
jgi:predicted glycosyltransferase